MKHKKRDGKWRFYSHFDVLRTLQFFLASHPYTLYTQQNKSKGRGEGGGEIFVMQSHTCNAAVQDNPIDMTYR